MDEKRKYHYRTGEVKAHILELILTEKFPLSEPTIRENLQKEYEGIDQSTINKHLNKLQDIGCIEKIPTVAGTRMSYWDITNVPQLRKIREIFKEINLSKYEKSFLLIIQTWGYDLRSPDGLQVYLRVLISPSFFEACINIGIDINENAWNFYRHSDGFGYFELIIEKQERFYTTYIKPNPRIDMGEETFRHTLAEIAHILKGESEGVVCKMLVQKLPGLSRDVYTELYDIVTLMESYTNLFNQYYLGLFLVHYFNQDLLTNIASPDEIDFIRKIKNNNVAYHKAKKSEDAYKIKILSDLKIESEIIFKYNQPSLFSEGCKTSDEVYELLQKHYNNFL